MKRAAAAMVIAAATGCAMPQKTADVPALRQQVADTERAFARTMAMRDFKAFRAFLAEEAIFFTGGKAVRGADQVAEAWKRFYEKPDAPFSWEPAEVEVLDSGKLALSSGPVRDPKGTVFATFTSIWRLEADGRWRIIFDKGNPVAPAKP